MLQKRTFLFVDNSGEKMILRTYNVKLRHNMQMIIPIEMRKFFGNNFVITEWDGYLLAIHYPTRV